MFEAIRVNVSRDLDFDSLEMRVQCGVTAFPVDGRDREQHYELMYLASSINEALENDRFCLYQQEILL